MRVPTRDLEDLPRHSWLEKFCNHLDNMIVAADSGQCPEEEAALVILPSWIFTKTQQYAGPKGENQLLPVRLCWDQPQVVFLAPGQSATAHWRTAGLGVRQEGEVLLTCGGRQETIWGSGPLPKSVAVTPLYPDEVKQEHSQLIADGNHSHFMALSILESPVKDAVSKVNKHLSADIYKHHAHLEGKATYSDTISDPSVAPPPLLGANEVDEVCDHMLVGSNLTALSKGTSEHSSIERLLAKAMHPDTFRKADPLRFMAQNIQRDAWDTVRRAVGEPHHMGPKVRQVFRDTKPKSIEELLDNYQSAYPKDRITRSIALAALTVSRSANSGTVPIDEEKARG